MVRTILFILLAYCSFSSNAQMISSDSVHGNNILKLNITSIAFSAINLQYERKISNKQSVALGLIYRVNGPVFNYFDRATGSPVLNPELSTVAITPEVKFYLNESFNGLYAGIYGRWRRNQVDFDYRLGITSDALIAIEYTENVLHLGGLIGYQTKLSKDIYLDFWVLGIGLSRSNIIGTLKDDLDLLKNGHNVNDIFKNLNGIYHRTFSYTNTTKSFEGEAWRAAFRGVGVSVGVRF